MLGFSSFGRTYKPKQYKKQVVSVDNLCALTTTTGCAVTSCCFLREEGAQQAYPSLFLYFKKQLYYQLLAI